MAAQFLKGIGLSPEQPIPFAQGFKTFQDPADLLADTKVNSMGNSTDEGSDSFESAPILPPVPVPTTGVASMPLRDYMSGTLDLSYYGPMSFGTPAQELTVDIDTGSADLWIPANCPDCNGNQFNPSVSSTYMDTHKKFSISYVRHFTLMSAVAHF